MDTMTLVPATGQVADALIAVAVADTHPDDVTPPLTPGEEWTPERITCLREYLRRCGSGLDDAGESVWGIVTSAPVGAVRLADSAQPGELETGIWLARSARGQGLATRALGAVLEHAWDAGATSVIAETAATNLPAQSALRSNGFTLSKAVTPGRVAAVRRRL